MSLNNTASTNSRAVILPNYYLTRVDWSTDNEDIATVDSNGKLTFKKTGMVLVTVKATIFARGYILELIGTRYELGYVPAENNSVFEFEGKTDIDDFDVKEKALKKMNEYYANKAEVRDFVDNNKTCIFAFEGLGEGFQGNNATANPNYHENSGYLNAMMLVTKGKKITYVTRRATTLPDNRPDVKENKEYCNGKITTLQNGVYDYKTGGHKGYIALVPNYKENQSDWPAWYLVDSEDDFHSDICESVNLHASGKNPASGGNANSMGCQTVYVLDYYDFGKAVGFLDKSLTKSPPTNYLSTNLPKDISASSDYKVDIKVKYILDRTYDEKNSYYKKELDNLVVGTQEYNDYQSEHKDVLNGVFYPINHVNCSTKDNYKCVRCSKK